jgi:CubicO group peptidase (beta-lactamase class C family)
MLLVMCAFVLLAAQPPDTPAGRTLAAWLEAFNSGERTKLKAFLEVYAPKRLDRLDDEMEFREETGGFELVRIGKSQPTELTALVWAREAGSYVELSLNVEPEPPHRIARMAFKSTPRPADIPAPPPLSETEALAAWKAEIERQAAADRFAGAALLARNGKVLFSQAHGLADRDKGVKNTLDTQFRLGSMNKMFTAVATLQLVQAGRLALDDPLVKHLPDYPNQDLARKVTVRHLLTHSGGTGDIFGPQYTKHRLGLRALNDYVKLYGARGLEFEPGSRWVYSNYGFLLLGVIVEKVSGKSYYDYVRDHIFKPAGMRSTDSLPEGQVVTKRAVGYMRRQDAWQPNADTLPWRGTSAGGGYSTVGDLLRFAEALTKGKLLDPKLVREATRVQAPGTTYGYGFSVSSEAGMLMFGHGGGAPGMNGTLRIYPERGYVMAVLSNLDPPAAGRVADWLEQRLPAK